MKTNDDRQHLTQAQLRLAVTLFWGPCQQVLLPARLKELAKVVNGAKNRYSIHRNLPLLTKVCLLYPLHILGYAGSFFASITSNSRYLPPYSPNLNLIERLWKFVKKHCIYSQY